MGEIKGGLVGGVLSCVGFGLRVRFDCEFVCLKNSFQG